MTIQKETCVTEWMSGDDVQTSWPFEFAIRVKADLTLYRRTIATGAIEVINPTLYSATFMPDDDAGGSITYPLVGLPASSEYEFLIERNAAYKQSTAFGGTQGSNSPLAIEKSLNYVTMLTQQNRRDVNRSLKLNYDADPLVEGQLLTVDQNGKIVSGPNSLNIEQQAQQVAADALQVASDKLAAEAAAQQAIDAASSVNGEKASRAFVIASYHPAVAPDFIRTAGYTTAGDQGGGLYRKRAVIEADGIGDFTILLEDGVTSARYAIAETYPNQFMFGAVGDGTTDDTTALQAYAQYNTDTGNYTRGVKATHLVTDQIVLMNNCDWGALTLVVNASTFAAASVIRIGGITGAIDLLYSKMIHAPELYNLDKTGLGWAGFDDKVALLTANIHNCWIWMRDIYGFGVGWKCAPVQVGHAQNTIYLQVLNSNKVNHEITGGDTVGYANQNVVMGGEYRHIEEGTMVVGTRHLYVHASPGGYRGHNNWTFVNTSFEYNVAEYHADIQGLYFMFLNCRWEATPPRIRIYSENVAESTDNVIFGGYDGSNIEFTFAGAASPYNSVVTPRHLAIEGDGRCATFVNHYGDTLGLGAHYRGYETGTRAAAKAWNDTEWTYKGYAYGLAFKNKTDTDYRAHYGTFGILFGDGAGGTDIYIKRSGSTFSFSAGLWPETDGNLTLGGGLLRWGEIFSSNAAINTSDAREKKWRGGLNEAELRVARRLADRIGTFQWLSSIEAKGEDGARIHVGLQAQDVEADFKAEGLDGFAYGLLCLDKWDDTYEDVYEDVQVGVRQERVPLLDKQGNPVFENHKVVYETVNIPVMGRQKTGQRLVAKASERMGLRPSQVDAFIKAGLNARLKEIEKRLGI